MRSTHSDAGGPRQPGAKALGGLPNLATKALLAKARQDAFARHAGGLAAEALQARLLRPHSRGWTGGRVDALLGVDGAAVGTSVWLSDAGGVSLTCELGPVPEALCACWVALDRLEPRERAVNGLAI